MVMQELIFFQVVNHASYMPTLAHESEASTVGIIEENQPFHSPANDHDDDSLATLSAVTGKKCSCCIFTPRACTRGKVIGCPSVVVVVVGTKIRTCYLRHTASKIMTKQLLILVSLKLQL